MQVKKVYNYMFLTLLSASANAFSAKDVFELQTYSIFDRDHVVVKVMNEKIDHANGQSVARGDLSIKILATREVLLEGVSNKLQNEYVNYQFPVGVLGKGETKHDRDLAEKMLSDNVAEYILHASLGESIKPGLIISRPNSQLNILKDEASSRSYLMIFGERVYVD